MRFREFFRNFRQGNVYIYRDALVRHWNRREYYVEVDVGHVNEYDAMLTQALQTRPDEILPYIESGAKDALQQFLTQQSAELVTEKSVPDFQVILKSSECTQSLRNLTAEHVNKLIKVPGIVISCQKSRAKATLLVVQCTKCLTIKRIQHKRMTGGIAIPTKCDRDGQQGDDCGPSPFTIIADSCEFIDQQWLKLQESPEVVPTGEMPRHISLVVDRYLVDRVVPGTRVSVMGVASLMNSSPKDRVGTNSTIRTQCLRCVGIQVDAEGGGRASMTFSPEEEEELQRLTRDPEIYEKIARSIAPQIQGEYTKDLKRAIACLLFGGSRKVLSDGVKLRGDINVLLMGDPSTAKSQFLKFVERVAPIGVYTSGKGSSAAGLTAAVNKSANGEFYLEGGAMVLADGGVICIDEFDKMREQDRVAIHEAMEQQTISIAKAGITTMLNSRTSVLAAANPIFGHYDDTKSVGDNIDLMTTILSRFDCIFIVRDVRDMERDRSIARHVLGVHMSAAMSESASGEIDVPTMKKLVAYCRDRCAPRLSDEAAAMLSDNYVHIRNSVRESLKGRSTESVVVPITVRQLEALVRLSEALAKMRLSAEATVPDVLEALRLFKVSTLAASQAHPSLMESGGNAPPEDVKRAEEFLKRRLGLRMTVNTKKIIEEAHAQGVSDEAVKRAISAMVMRSELQELNQRKMLRRVK